jgi:membrane associated rhomboid family serine protease
MRFSISTIIGIFLGVSTFMFYVSNVRPVGWFDSLVGMILGVVVFVVVKRFKGFK